MAVAVATPTVTSVENQPAAIVVRGTIAVGASPLTYATGGIVLDLTAGFQPGASLPANAAPRTCYIESAKLAGVSGLQYGYRPGTAASNGKLQVFVGPASSGGALDELAAGAVPAAASGDTIIYEAVFAKFL